MMFEQDSNLKKFLTLVFCILLFAGLVYLVYTVQYSQPQANQTGLTVPAQGAITIEGKIVCLPHRDSSGPQTLECAYGLLDATGRYFALADSDSEHSSFNDLSMNIRVSVEGIFTPQTSDKYVDIGTIKVSSISPVYTKSWNTITDQKNNATFRYPESLDAKYIHTVDWPPQLQVLAKSFACTAGGSETARAGKTEERLVDDREYCVTKVTEGAAGSVYTQYAYAFSKGNKTAIFTFSLRSDQCGNYDEADKNSCEAEREAFDIDSVVDRIAQTLVLE